MITTTAAVLTAVTGQASAGDLPEFRLLKPSNTGIPGEEVRRVTFDPNGDLWVAARWPFWSEGGFATYDFDTEVWTAYANWETPLPSERINDVEFEAGGITWIATDNGLVRFDGTNWQIFNVSNSPLVHNKIRAIDRDSQGALWINNSGPATLDAALFRYDGVTWESFHVGEELPWEMPWEQLSGLTVDSNDHVWIGNVVLPGVAEYDGVTWTLHEPGVETISGVMEAPNGDYWMMTGGLSYSLYRYDGETFTQLSDVSMGFAHTTLTTLSYDAQGRIYVGNWVGDVRRFDGTSWQHFTNTGGYTVYGILPRPDGDVWIQTIGAVRHHDAGGAWLEAFNTYNTGLPDYFVNSFYTDREDEFWFLTGEAGGSKYDGERFRNWSAHNAESEVWPFGFGTPAGAEHLDAILHDEDGNFWFGGNGVARGDLTTWEIWDWTSAPFGSSNINSFATDLDGDLWIGTDFSSVYRFNGSGWEHHPFAPYGWTASEVEDMTTDGDGNLWVVSYIAVHKFDGAVWQSWDSTTSPLPLGSLTSIAAHPDGSMWIGSQAGLTRFDGTSWQTYNASNSPMPATFVTDIDIREDGLVAATARDFGPITPFPNGVVTFDGTNWEVYSYGSTPLPHYQLEACAFDADGDLWVSPISEGVVEIVIGGDMTSSPADLDDDGVVGATDLAMLLGAWGPCASTCAADLDGNGIVNAADLAILLGAWG